MPHIHRYDSTVHWSGSTAGGYRDYSRTHRVNVGTNELQVTADTPFGGEAGVLNPEQLLLAAAASCQLLSFLALAAREGLDVREYSDEAQALMPVPRAEAGQPAPPMRITEVLLRPQIVVAPGTDVDLVHDLVARGHEQCFIANTLNATMRLEPTIREAAA